MPEEFAVREEKLFKQCCERWEDFCSSYLNLSRAEADRIVRLLDEYRRGRRFYGRMGLPPFRCPASLR
jgi:hypothetical protein